MIKYDYCTIDKDKDEIVHISFTKTNVKLTGDNSLEIFNSRLTLSPENSKQLVLVDLRTEPKPDRYSREFAKSPQMNKHTKALALIVKSGFSSVLGNLFLSIFRGNYPVKIFTNKEEATNWLKSI